MSVIKAKGIVLKEIDSGESGKTLIILAEGLGRIIASARGAKKITGRLFSASEAFTCGEYCFYQGRGFYSVTQAEVLEKFYPIRSDVEKLAYACYFSDMVSECVFEGMEADDVLRLLLRTLTVLSKTDIPPRLAARVFELRFLKIMGFQSDEPENVLPLSKDAADAVSYILTADESRAFAFRASDDVLREMSLYTSDRIVFYIGKRFRSLDFAEEF